MLIPIAIYRAPNPTVLGNESPFIITNPEKDTLLLTGDIVYVLGETSAWADQRNREQKEGLAKLEKQKNEKQEVTDEYLGNIRDPDLLQEILHQLLVTGKEREKERDKMVPQ